MELNDNDLKMLGGYKRLNNKATELPSIIDINKLFLSNSNKTLVTVKIYKNNEQNGGNDDQNYNDLYNKVEKSMVVFQKNTNLKNYENVEDDAMQIKNWVKILRSINYDFVNQYNSNVKHNNFIPSMEWTTVGSMDNRTKKRYTDITAQDVPTLNLWDDYEIKRSNGSFKNNNKIPIWRTSTQKRHYDRNNEGLHNNSDRSSLENPVYGKFDTSKLHYSINNWNKDEWFGS